MSKDKILFWDDERDIGNSIIVTLNYGWHYAAGDIGEHVRGFDSISEAKKAVNESVKCTCDECVAVLEAKKKYLTNN